MSIEIRESVPLRECSTLHIGGPARYFCSVSSVEDLRSAVRFAKEKSVPFVVCGGGSNILWSDGGFPGLVIHMRIMGVQYEEDGDAVRVIANAGENWDGLVADSVSRGLYGVENLSCIPGTVGASPIQNIGAYGAEVKDVIEWVEIYDTETENLRRFAHVECQFGYRDSFFKTEEGKRFLVVRVCFSLQKEDSVQFSYRDIKDYFAGRDPKDVSPGEMREAVCAIRSKKFPDWQVVGTAGSFFKNPVITNEKYAELKRAYPDMPLFPAGENKVKAPLGWICDRVCGLRGVRRGNVGTHAAQALVFVAYANATAHEVVSFAGFVAQTVKEKTGIVIEWEVTYMQCNLKSYISK